MITGLIVAKNEAHRIGRCIESIIEGVDRVLIYDTGSSDDTVKIAEAFGSKVHVEHGYFDCFVDTYNRAIELVQTDKILHMAADEWFASPAALATVLDAIRAHDVVDVLTKDFDTEMRYLGQVSKARGFASRLRYGGPYTHEYIVYTEADLYRQVEEGAFVCHMPNKGADGTKRRAEQDRYWLEKYLTDQPQGRDVARAHFYLYKICLFLGDIPAYEKHLKDLRKTCPYATIYTNQADLDEATYKGGVEPLRALVTRRPDVPAFQYFAGRELMIAGFFEEAERCLKLAVALPRPAHTGILCENEYYYALFPLRCLGEMYQIQGRQNDLGFVLGLIKAISVEYYKDSLESYKRRKMWGFLL